MKKYLGLLLTFVMLVTLTACTGTKSNISLKEDGSGVLKYRVMVDSGVNKSLFGDEKSQERIKKLENCKVIEELQDDVYYVSYEFTEEFANVTELTKILKGKGQISKSITDLMKASSLISDSGLSEALDEELADELFPYTSSDISGDHFQLVLEGADIAQYLEEYDEYGIADVYEPFINMIRNGVIFQISVTFENEINDSNGTLSDDKHTATWDVDLLSGNTILRASTAGKTAYPVDNTPPTIKYVSNNAYYRTTKWFLVTDKTGIKEVKCNNKKVSSEDCVERQGTYTLTATDFDGNKSTVKFTIDKKRPTVSGVANGKSYVSNKTIKFTDNYGIKSAKLNGKSIKTGYTVSKQGSYKLVLEDKAGNISTVKFVIDKKNPTVSGVAYGKTYHSKRTIKFKDNGGIKSAKLNGKNIKTGYVVSKPGNYKLVVQDKAGNVTMVKFRIAK